MSKIDFTFKQSYKVHIKKLSDIYQKRINLKLKNQKGKRKMIRQSKRNKPKFLRSNQKNKSKNGKTRSLEQENRFKLPPLQFKVINRKKSKAVIQNKYRNSNSGKLNISDLQLKTNKDRPAVQLINLSPISNDRISNYRDFNSKLGQVKQSRLNTGSSDGQSYIKSEDSNKIFEKVKQRGYSLNIEKTDRSNNNRRKNEIQMKTDRISRKEWKFKSEKHEKNRFKNYERNGPSSKQHVNKIKDSKSDTEVEKNSRIQESQNNTLNSSIIESDHLRPQKSKQKQKWTSKDKYSLQLIPLKELDSILKVKKSQVEVNNINLLSGKISLIKQGENYERQNIYLKIKSHFIKDVLIEVSWIGIQNTKERSEALIKSEGRLIQQNSIKIFQISKQAILDTEQCILLVKSAKLNLNFTGKSLLNYIISHHLYSNHYQQKSTHQKKIRNREGPVILFMEEGILTFLKEL